MPELDASLLAYAVREEALGELQGAGLELDDFTEDYATMWRWLLRQHRTHDAVPSEDTLRARFPELELPDTVRARELPMLLSDIKKRRKFRQFLQLLNQVAGEVTDYDSVEDVISGMLGQLTTLAFQGQRAHLRDLFSAEVNAEALAELHRRYSGQTAGIPTGLPRLDRHTGGLMAQKMVVVIGRSGRGKSWINLLFVMNAVLQGYKVILYPLEMSLMETAFRLYTLFSSKLLGMDHALVNTDLNLGRTSTNDAKRFLRQMQQRFEGRLLVADVGALSDPYTIERIEAEVELHRPDMIWVDYLTLLRSPAGADADWVKVRQLSSGIKSIAMRRNVVGGCSAQVNREAVRGDVFLPGLEHISYGDSIGQDADLVIPINRSGRYLHYALTKHRGGAEFGNTRVIFNPNQGELRELSRDEAAVAEEAAQ